MFLNNGRYIAYICNGSRTSPEISCFILLSKFVKLESIPDRNKLYLLFNNAQTGSRSILKTVKNMTSKAHETVRENVLFRPTDPNV